MGKWDEHDYMSRYSRGADGNVSINRKQIKGKHADNIIAGIKTAFAPLYPNKEIQVRQEKDGQANYFEVYVEGQAFNFEAPYLERKTFLYIDKYSNDAAIKIFATNAEDDIHGKFNDYSADNLLWLNEQFSALATAYKMRGITLYEYYAKPNQYSPNTGSWRVNFANEVDWNKKKNGGYFDGRGYIDGCFDRVPVSKTTAQGILRKVKSAIESYIKDPNKY